MTHRAIAADHWHALGRAGTEKRQDEFCARFGVETMVLNWQAEKAPTFNSQPTTLNQCCVTGMTWQSLSSKWPVAKARRRSMSSPTCDREATQAPGYFQFNPSGRGSLGEFPRRSLGQPRKLSGQRFACSLKFAQTRRGDCQAIPVTQH